MSLPQAIEPAVEVRRKILDLRQLPPLSMTATDLLRAVSDPEVGPDELDTIIARDPGLVARILGLANAAYFARARPVTTVREAVIRVLGLALVKSLGLSIAIGGSFRTGRCRSFDLERYWCSALGCAALARSLALRVPAERRPDVASVYLCGTLRNLGLLVLVHVAPDAMSRVLSKSREDPGQDLLDLEREALGVDHRQAGEWLVQRWHIPDTVARAIAHHRQDAYQGKDWETVLLVGAATDAVEALAVGQGPDGTAANALQRRLHIPTTAIRQVYAAFAEQFQELRAVAALLH